MNHYPFLLPRKWHDLVDVPVREHLQHLLRRRQLLLQRLVEALEKLSDLTGWQVSRQRFWGS